MTGCASGGNLIRKLDEWMSKTSPQNQGIRRLKFGTISKGKEAVS